MTITAAAEATRADVLRQLGGISPKRVRSNPALGKATESDVIRIRDRERRLFELVHGVLVEKVMDYWQSVLALELGRLLGNYVARHKLGSVAGEAGILLLSPGLVRIPDLSFTSKARLAQHRRDRPPILPLAPDLAIEVVSEGNTRREMKQSALLIFNRNARENLIGIEQTSNLVGVLGVLLQRIVALAYQSLGSWGYPATSSAVTAVLPRMVKWTQPPHRGQQPAKPTSFHQARTSC
jgi:hypothetical protein